jgi:spore germination protein GerM
VRGIAAVDLTPGFAELPGDRQLRAVAQMTCTLTAQPGVGQVRYTLGGSSIAVPRADGSVTGDPVTRQDYGSLLASA